MGNLLCACDMLVYLNFGFVCNFSGQRQDFLLGDPGYALPPFLLTPFPHPVNTGEDRYKQVHSQTRVKIEQCNGIVERRFARLHYRLSEQPPKRHV